jgi:SAM-dependent methyltransferase
LNETSEPFDIAISIRCLINLPSWDLQSRALKEIADVIRPGGLYMCSEGWQDGWDELNLARERTGLSPMEVVSYNKLIRRSDFEAEAGKYFEIINYHSLGLYLFLSRVFQPNFVKPETPSHTHDINRVAMELQNSMKAAHYFPDCDYAGVYILKRK